MEFPSRKARRKKNKNKIKISLLMITVLSALIILNLLLLFKQNFLMLSFGLPLFFLIVVVIFFRNKRKWLFISLFLLLISYFSFFEISYRIWAQK